MGSMDSSQASPEEAPIVARMSTLDRFLPVWILVAMGLGLLLGRTIPGLNEALDSVKIGETSLLIALGLLMMMYPVLAKVRYEDMGKITSDHELLWVSLLLNWVIGPALMFALAWIFLADQPAFRTGLIVIGLARCIAMVLIWNDLACGSSESAALLVAINSGFQILAYALLGTFYLKVLPGWLGLDTQDAQFSTMAITVSVLVFLGIPLFAGYLTRRIGIRAKGRVWYEKKFMPRLGPFALYGLLFTIVIMFGLQGDAITSDPWAVVRIGIPLIAYFAIMWGGSFILSARIGLSYAKTAAVAFTAAGNNFELAIAVSIGVWGVTSGQALAGVVGPLIEVPVLLALVYLALFLRKKMTWPNPEQAKTPT
jgi:ACR3 family arsenite transporter